MPVQEMQLRHKLFPRDSQAVTVDCATLIAHRYVRKLTKVPIPVLSAGDLCC